MAAIVTTGIDLAKKVFALPGLMALQAAEPGEAKGRAQSSDQNPHQPSPVPGG